MAVLKSNSSKRWLIAVCALVYFVSYFSRKDFAAVMVGMISDGTINEAVGGYIGMGLFICYGFGQLISGYLGDRVKPRTLILIGVATTLVCNLCMPLVSDLSSALMIPIWAVNGLAQAMLWPPIVRLLAEYLDHEKYIMANLVVTIAAHVATILLYLYVPLCLKWFDWQTVFFTASAMALLSIPVFIIALHIIIPEEHERHRISDEHQSVSSMDLSPEVVSHAEKYLPLMKRAGIIPILVCIIMMGYLRDGIETWLPTMYSQTFNKDASESVLVSVVLPIFSILSIVVITALHKTRLFKNEVLGTMVLFIVCICLCIPLYFMMNAETFALQVICMVLAGAVCACMHGINFLLISCLPGYFASHGKAATTSGLCNSCTYVGAALSMYGIPLIKEWLGWGATVLSWAIVAAVGVAFALVAIRSFTRFIKEET